MSKNCLIFLCALLCANGWAADCLAGSCPQFSPAVSRVVTKLQQLQYNVECGSVSFQISQQGQCEADQGVTNPATCYGRYNLPAPNGGAAATLFQLDDDEAILTLGTLPPSSFYYGYYTYIKNRLDPTASPPDYVAIRAPIGPAMNQRNADPALHAQLGGNTYQLFGKSTAIVTTANTITQNDIVSALSSAYGASQSQNMLYVEKLPVDLVDLGTSSTADQLATAFRLTPFTTTSGQLNAAALQYMENPPIQIFRITPIVPRTQDASATYHLVDDPLPPTKVSPSQVWEQVLLSRAGVASGSQALAQIINNVIADRAAKGETLRSQQTPPSGVGLLGRSCIAAFESGVAMAQQSGKPLVVTNNMLCQDGSPDAAYFGSATPTSFPTGGEIVWVGVNRGTLGSATYSSVALQQPSADANALNNVTLAGSATPFLGTIPASAGGDFYVVSLNATCAEGSSNCLYAPGHTSLALDERAYLAPITATMPDYTDIFAPTWLFFNPP